MGPNIPEAGLIPTLLWYFMRAAFVAPPKRVVSLPGEPAPVAATIEPFPFKNCWSIFTAEPVEPNERLPISESLELLRYAFMLSGIAIPMADACMMSAFNWLTSVFICSCCDVAVNTGVFTTGVVTTGVVTTGVGVGVGVGVVTTGLVPTYGVPDPPAERKPTLEAESMVVSPPPLAVNMNDSPFTAGT